jgi:hypothetical protein
MPISRVRSMTLSVIAFASATMLIATISKPKTAIVDAIVSARTPRGRIADLRALVESSALTRLGRARYLIRLSILNIGRYIEMMTTPTIMPTPIIMIGSMIEVRAWMEASTSSS